MGIEDVGLGPTICCRCQVFANLLVGPNDYRCPVCGQEDDLEYLWMFTEEQQKKIYNNTRFYRFVLGNDVPQDNS